MPWLPRIQGMRYLTLQDRVRAFPVMAVAVAVLGATMLSAGSTPEAQAKGAVELKLCGTDGCAKRKTPRFTAAMLYGGRSHDGPSCGTRVHTVTASMPGGEGDRRFLVVASRGLIGEQLERGKAWWRQVRGARKADLKRVARSTGRGFKAEPDLRVSLNRRSHPPRWRFREGLITCARPG